MKKRIFIIGLLCLLVLAGESVKANSGYTEINKEEIIDVMLNDIENEKSIANKEIYQQLKAQDALILQESFEEFFSLQIETQIKEEYLMKYGKLIAEDNIMKDFSTNSMKSYYLPKGGSVAYYNPMPSGYQPTHMMVIGMNRDDSYTYFLNKYSFSPRDLFTAILGFVPNEYVSGFGNVLSLNSVVTALQLNKVKNADGCAQIVSNYSPEYGTGASILQGWTDRFYIRIPSDAYNVKTKSF